MAVFFIDTDQRNLENIIGAHGLGDRNEDGGRILDFAVINYLSILNIYYRHSASYKWTMYKWNTQHQIYTQQSTIDLFATDN